VNIYIDGQIVNKTTDQMISCLNDFDNNIKTLSNILANMETAWSGDDATYFFNTMKEKNIPELKRLHDVLFDYSNFLQKIPGTYQILDEVYTSKGIDF